MISAETVEQINKDQNGMCACKGLFCKKRIEHMHHIYSKGKTDSDDRWNMCGLSVDCHVGANSIHARLPNARKNVILDKMLKAEADKRKPKEDRSKTKDPRLTRLARQRKQWRKRKIDSYKSSHNGLSPSQVAYRKMKELKN